MRKKRDSIIRRLYWDQVNWLFSKLKDQICYSRQQVQLGSWGKGKTLRQVWQTILVLEVKNSNLSSSGSNDSYLHINGSQLKKWEENDINTVLYLNLNRTLTELDLNNTMSMWIMAVFPESVRSLGLESMFLNPLYRLGKCLRYRFLQVPIKCSLEFCRNQGSGNEINIYIKRLDSNLI